MAYDPEAGETSALSEQIDAIYYGPVELAQRAARRVALELNSLPPEERTDDIRERMESLSEAAHAAARDANLELLQGPEAAQ